MREFRKRRRWNSDDGNDPLAAMTNLIDIWAVFSFAILIAYAGTIKRTAQARADMADSPERSIAPDEIPKVRISRESLRSSGEKLGVAYRMPSGEIVCVPDR